MKSGAGTSPLAALVTSQATFDAVLKANNPDFAYVDHDAQGYASATLTASSLQVIYTKMKPLTSSGTVPDSPVLKRTRITLAAGSKQPVVTDNV